MHKFAKNIRRLLKTFLRATLRSTWNKSHFLNQCRLVKKYSQKKLCKRKGATARRRKEKKHFASLRLRVFAFKKLLTKRH